MRQRLGVKEVNKREKERERERLSRVRKYVSKASSTMRSILG